MFVSAEQVCPELFAGGGAKALGRILDSSEFRIRDEKRSASADAAARAMARAYRAGKGVRDSSQPECEVSGPVQEIGDSRAWPTAVLRFTASSKLGDTGLPERAPGISFTVAGADAYLGFDCVSAQVGSTAAIPLTISIGFDDHWTPRKGTPDGSEHPKELAAVLHSAATSVARKLECSDNGGLPARSEDLKAVPPRK
ncbi:hypothetical protein ACWCQL_18985 [Streptomyces sp. NPDC002073]